MRAFVFPGQGAQTIGMGQALAANYPVAKAVFDEVDDALGQDLSGLIWEGDIETLTLTANAQPALMATSLAALRALQAEGMALDTASFVVGHSLGEYSALAAAGAISIADTARLLRIRGTAMQEAVPVGVGAMAAILGMDFAALTALAEAAAQGDVCQAANDNDPGQVVVSGHRAAVERALDLAKEAGAKRAVLLPVSAPFHCKLMNNATLVMKEEIAKLNFNEPKNILISNVTGKEISNSNELKELLVKQIESSVRWRESVLLMIEKGVTEFIEIGPGKVLSGLIKRIDKNVKVSAINSEEDIKLININE